MLRRALPAVLAFLLAAAVACSGDDGGERLEPTYANVEMVLDATCALGSSCHGGTGRGQANLNIERAIANGTLLDELLLPSCEYDRMPRVAPGNPDGSWLMVKMTAPTDADGNIEFTPAADWTPDPDSPHPDTICPRTVGGEIRFGTIMPSVVPFEGPPPEHVEMFREWIAMGAPGPAM